MWHYKHDCIACLYDRGLECARNEYLIVIRSNDLIDMHLMWCEIQWWEQDTNCQDQDQDQDSVAQNQDQDKDSETQDQDQDLDSEPTDQQTRK